MAEKLIELRNISKQFPGVLANDNVSLDIEKGEIHAIVGENGAGKSTLMKILYGLYQPTYGEIYINGEPVKIKTPLDAINLGIGMVHQHFMLVPSFTVAENIVLGVEPRKNKVFTDYHKAVKIAEKLSEEYGLKVDPHAKVESLSVGIQQRIEILKVLNKGADIIILDEPTAVLTPQETEELFKVIRSLVDKLGKTVIIITHKLQEVLDLSNRVSVMRQGRMVGTLETKNANEQILAEMMVGREVLFEDLMRKNISKKEVLKVKNIKARDNRGLIALKGVSFNLHSGEILGIAGVEGNGQSELLEVLTGLRLAEEGSILVNGVEAINKQPLEIRELGISHIPEDRLSTGLSREATLTENMILGFHRKEPYAIKGIHLNRKKIRERADRLIKEYDIRTPSQDVIADNLSGGNMQKMVIAREFSFDSEILIIAQPTRGVDIGAIEFIHKEIINKRNEGAAILLVSADLDEIFRLSDRIITLYEGEITGEFLRDEITKNEIGLYMTGKRRL
ncbi:ABC transporter ATP-binding protein [Tepidimicrobium xylanilyticum]|uniref:Nucleoside ABC transporter ATP-binding protein n=1 Tax=Tepidimicrobium xylanilyticum TaxID=1123352 RepID=A0A1H3A552_9FIRM|nr:ABC transporter ATP-binding protein [Tepidimicrobium xylanilyticum]GMG96310.1 heme ABC transporter ATP-binding protein [Tepidimicrobium xylanilyticum]SDX24872.1 nucleoside ABC transporter ATP-binding protein [Tepidimicrobium xylanilyticum]